MSEENVQPQEGFQQDEGVTVADILARELEFGAEEDEQDAPEPTDEDAVVEEAEPDDVEEEEPAAQSDYDALISAMADNPVEFMRRMAEGLTPEQAAELGIAKRTARDATPSNPLGLEPDSGDGEWEPQSVAEGVLVQEVAKLRSFPEQINEVLTKSYAPVLNDAHIEATAALALIAPLYKALGMEIPKFDRGAMHKALEKPGATFEAVVTAHLGKKIEASLASKAQASKPRPNTPSGSGGHAVTAPVKGMSVREIAKRVAEQSSR